MKITLIYSIYSSLNVIQRPTPGQAKLLFKKHLIVLILPENGYGPYYKFFSDLFYVCTLFLAVIHCPLLCIPDHLITFALLIYKCETVVSKEPVEQGHFHVKKYNRAN